MCIKVIKDRYGTLLLVIIDGKPFWYKPEGGILEGYNRDCDPTSSNYDEDFCNGLVDYYKSVYGYDLEDDADR